MSNHHFQHIRMTHHTIQNCTQSNNLLDQLFLHEIPLQENYQDLPRVWRILIRRRFWLVVQWEEALLLSLEFWDLDRDDPLQALLLLEAKLQLLDILQNLMEFELLQWLLRSYLRPFYASEVLNLKCYEMLRNRFEQFDQKLWNRKKNGLDQAFLIVYNFYNDLFIV